jgi:hypothetical protein
VADVTRSHLVAAWCRWYDKRDPADEWAEQEVIADIVGGDLPTNDAWDLILELLREAPNDAVLGIIGASPVEDLLAHDPQIVAALIEREAPRNPRLRQSLSHTWPMPSVPADVFNRVRGPSDPLLRSEERDPPF